MTLSAIGMNRKNGNYTTRFNDGSSVTVREEWSVEDAIEGIVNEWFTPVARDKTGAELNELTDTHLQAAHITRIIRDASGKQLALLVDPQIIAKGEAAISRINDDAYGEQGKKYQPFTHAPNATTDRLIGTEVLERMIVSVLERHGVEVTDEVREQTKYDALVGAIMFSFDPDSRGLMPVMTPGRAADGSFSEWYWSLLFPTKVAGLFLRVDDDILGGTAYSLVTGGGWGLMRGFWEREYAEELAVKFAEAVPGLDWFQVHAHALTSELKATLVAIAREHGPWRKDVK